MTQTTYSDNVLIDGSQDIKQLRVQGHTTQTQQLQTWEDSAGNVLGQVTGDGRLIVGDNVTPDSLIEAHRLDTSTSKPKRGIHSLGQVSGTLNTLVQWIVGELELKGSTAIDALHTALRIRASNLNTGTPTGNAELRGGDIEVINDATASASALTKATGLQVGVTNAAGKTITDAIGLKVKMNNSGTMTNPFAIYTEGPGAIHLEDYVEIKRPSSVPGTPNTDFMRVYPRSNGRLYTKNWLGNEFELTGVDDPGINNVRLSLSSTDPNPAPGSNGTSIYLHPFNGEQISLYDTVSGKFIPRPVSSPIAFDMTAAGALGGNQVPFMPQDVFLAWDAVNNVFLKKVIPWAAAPIQKSVTNITNASPPVLTVGASHGFAVNDLVVLQDVTGGAASLTNKLYRVTAVAATTVSLGNLDATSAAAPGGTSTNGSLYKVTAQITRATAFTTLRGAKTYFDVGSGNYYKHLGTVSYGSVKETIYDTLQYPFVWNRYGQVEREVGTMETSNVVVSWTGSTNTDTPTNARAMGNRYQERQWLLTGEDNQLVDINLNVLAINPTGVVATTGCIIHSSLDAIANFAWNNRNFPATTEYTFSSTTATSDLYYRMLNSHYKRQISAGLHFLQPMEYFYNSGSNQWSLYKNVQSGQLQEVGGYHGQYLR